MPRARFELPTEIDVKYNHWVLGGFKLVQLILSVACLLVHILSYTILDNEFPHVTLFCGTYLGFTIISCALLLVHSLGDELLYLDLFFCFFGGCCYCTCSIVAMLVAKETIYSQESVHHPFQVDIALYDYIAVARILSTVAGLCYWADFSITYDIWRGRRRKLRATEEEDNEERMLVKTWTMFIEDDDELVLHCVFVDIFSHLKSCCKNVRKRERRIKEKISQFDIEDYVKVCRMCKEKQRKLSEELSNNSAQALESVALESEKGTTS